MFFICKIYELCEYNIVMFEQGVLIADRYKLISLLGKGGFSEVWLAEDILTNIRVAIKIYAPGVGLDDAGISLFTQEFSLVFDMNHTNLLHPTHFDCWQRMPFLILPYCQNGSAFKYVSPDMQISEDEAWKVLHDVAAGLAYLHGKNPPIIHQDIKPDNILISDEGHYMITDFGISTRIRSTLKRSAAEMSGGTIAYMGPERFSETPHPIMASDIWSLGAMMYELMTGNTVYGEFGGMLQKKGADIPLIEGEYSPKLKNLIYRCVALETWDRPTAEQIEKETNEYFLGRDETILPETPPVEKQVINKEEKILSKKDYKKWSIGVGILGLLIIVIFQFLGREKTEVVLPPPIYYQDSLNCLKHLEEGDRLLQSVEQMMDLDSIVYEEVDSSIYLEDILIPAHTEYFSALKIIENTGIKIDKEDIVSDLQEIEQVLDSLNAYCDNGIKSLEDFEDMKQYVDKFRVRKQNINNFKL